MEQISVIQILNNHFLLKQLWQAIKKIIKLKVELF